MAALVISASGASLAGGCKPLTEEGRRRLGIDAFYDKVVESDGLVFVASSNTTDFALLEARYLVDHMLQGNPALRRSLADAKLRIAVMAPSEMTTDLPEHRHLRPAKYWDRRARGLGASPSNPVVSCGEENLLELPGDPYAGESILVHEFAHAVHQLGMAERPDFDGRLCAAFEHAIEAGLWSNTYAAANHSEYWAEGAQIWFHCNRPPDKIHNDIRTREQLEAYDGRLYQLLAETFGQNKWRYEPPSDRKDSGHLTGLDKAPSREFRWPGYLADVNIDEPPAEKDDVQRTSP